MLRGMSEEARYRAAIDDHEKQIERFRRGEISAEELRPLRLAMGVYAQLAEVKHMQRIKIPGGAVSADQLDAIADVTERWGRGLAHVTTRQDFQLHYLELEDTVEVQRVLAERGVYTVGACADTVRNVTASPYAGVLDDELFDVTPYAHAITHYFAFHQHNRRLPRKFKIGLTGSAQDHAQVMINDLGFFAAFPTFEERAARFNQAVDRHTNWGPTGYYMLIARLLETTGVDLDRPMGTRIVDSLT